ncbi:hypothetical protein APS47_15375 [Leptospira kirschneri serovar Mozdok]|uniref:hypothetical protein n=1 Tax=Leptospira kirschneri TaxID=29507 RepID=UPI000361033A|nr:hypothetical protein [Leptospira kirschneri]KON78210.1 Uncharacterized protein NV38_0001103 [Leptospira kirschneri serovar Mozdok]KPZ76468.1 hypothetical protein APS47_15375 [Leptospira kirschneri serovar Mozdok]NDK04637.1 hypothetical protein [Leptospira kirschneri serovar Mozdok]
MTKQAAQDRCNQLGMRLPTFREAYFARITDEWIGEYQSENLSYGGTSTQGFNLFYSRHRILCIFSMEWKRAYSMHS